MSNVQKPGELPPPTENDGAVGMDQQPTLALAVAGTMDIPASEDRPALMMLFMADGTVRWIAESDVEK